MRLLACGLMGLMLATPAQAQTLLDRAPGRWTTRGIQACPTRFYAWTVGAGEIRFVDQDGAVDLERILAVRPDRLETVTIASSQVKAGTRWAYQLQPDGSIQVSGGGRFVLTKCPSAEPPSLPDLLRLPPS